MLRLGQRFHECRSQEHCPGHHPMSQQQRAARWPGLFYLQPMTKTPYLTPELRIVGLSPNHWAVEVDEHGSYYFRERTEAEWLDIIDPRKRVAMHQAEVEAYLSELTGEPPYTIRTGRKVPPASSTGKVPSGNVRAFYAELREKADIVEVAQRLTDMRHMGRTWKGLCPFHAERHESFVVWPETRTWRCFGACAESGDVVSLWGKAKRAGLI